jgi:4'-phosphopantetheinyl transferase EntD
MLIAMMKKKVKELMMMMMMMMVVVVEKKKEHHPSVCKRKVGHMAKKKLNRSNHQPFHSLAHSLIRRKVSFYFSRVCA